MPPRQRIGRTRNTALRLLAALGYGVVSSATRVAILAARPLIVLALRQLVRNRTFWERGLRGAWSRKVRHMSQPVFMFTTVADWRTLAGRWSRIDTMRAAAHVCAYYEPRMLCIIAAQNAVCDVAHSSEEAL